MTSFELYTKYRNDGSANRTSFQKEYANDVLELLWKETLDITKGFANIEFISVIKKMIEDTKFYRKIDETRIYVYDAYFFVAALYKCIQNKGYIDRVITEDNLSFLFKELKCEKSDRINVLDKTNTIINKIEVAIRNGSERAKTKIVQAKNCQIDLNVRESSQMPGYFSNGSSTNEMGDNQQDNIGNETEKDLLREKETEETECQTNELETKQGTDCDVSVRRKQNKVIIDKWHSEIDDISRELKSIQPSVKAMLENIMGFSEKLTEKCVLQFAKMQIELFDFIHDNYEYHHRKSELSENQDYINAVTNYEEFLFSISDSLSVFGIEEIVSCEGSSFDGGIHECESDDFSSKKAIVKRSVRAGFRYKDIIIQKEKVEL